MALKLIEYELGITGVTPAQEQFGGTQGDHNITKLNIKFSDAMFKTISENAGDNNVLYRFDVYDGQGGIWQSESKKMEQDLTFMLEERHTRYGGKLTVYVVITLLSQDGKTEMELYSFPIVLKLKDRPDGIYQNGGNYESVTGLVEVAKHMADTATNKSEIAQKAVSEIADLLKSIDMKITDKIDQTYLPLSENAQSGKAVKEAIDIALTALYNYYTKQDIDEKNGDMWDMISSQQEDISALFNTVCDIETLLGGI